MRPPFFVELRRTFALAVPIMAGQLGQMLHGIADTVMLGRVGVTELAASTFANALVHPPFVFGIGVLTCISMRVSQERGAGRPEAAAQTLRHGLILAAVSGAAVVALLFALIPCFPLFHQPAEVLARTPEFYGPIAVSILPALLVLALKNFADAMARPWVPFGIMFGGVLLNVALNWVMIFGNLGCPPLGLAGAAWATLISRVVALIVLGLWVWRTPAFAGWRPDRWGAPLVAAKLRRMLSLGLPVSFALVVEVAAFNFGALMTGWISAGSLAAHQIALICAATTFMVPLGLSMATTVRVGACLGADEKERVRTVAGGALLGALVIMATAALVFFCFRQQIAGCFVKEPAVRALAARLLIIAGLFQLADGLQVVAAGALRGLNDVRCPAAIAVASYWLVAIPIGWFAAFGLHWNTEGVWTGFAAGLAVAAIALCWRLTRKTQARHAPAS